jgi:heptaprenyl diphosphate synthase
MALALKLLEPILRAGQAGELTDFLRETEENLASVSRSKTGFLAQLTEYVMTGSGKRVRPALVFLGSQFGKADRHTVSQTALAVEMIHIATLVHDDLVDEAVIRRQRPTVGVKFGEGVRGPPGGFRLRRGVSTVVRVGALGPHDPLRRFHHVHVRGRNRPI